MSPRKTITESGIPSEREVIEGLGVRWLVPPFVVRRELVAPPVRIGEDVDATPRAQEGVIVMDWNGSGQRFVVEYKAPGTPRQIDMAILQLRRYLTASTDLRPLIVAPFLKPETLDRLVEEGISALDLSGNMAITIPNRWLVIRTGAPNRYPSSATIKNIYKGQSGLVCRALMLKGAYPTATAIARELGAAAGVTPPTISKVLSALEEDLLIARDRDGVRVIQPSRLLENLVANYRAPVERRVVRGKVSDPDALRSRLRALSAGASPAVAIDAPERYTIYPSGTSLQRIYTSATDEVTDGVSVDVGARFPDVAIIETDDPTAYYGRVFGDGVYWTSPLQVYLELARGGKRAEEVAAPIRDDLLRYRYA